MSKEKLEIDKFDLFVENCPACESETCEKIMYVDGNYPKVDCEYHFCNLYGEKKKECGEIKDCIIKNTIKQLQTAKEENEKLKEELEFYSSIEVKKALTDYRTGDNAVMRRVLEKENKRLKDTYVQANIDLTQQNKQLREALEKVKFEAEFNGNDESLQKIINIIDKTLKGCEYERT